MKIKNKYIKVVCIIVASLLLLALISAMAVGLFSADVPSGVNPVTQCELYGHSFVTSHGNNVSCISNGYTDYVYCENCHMVEKDREVIKALGHHEPEEYYGHVSCKNCSLDLGTEYYTIDEFYKATKDYDASIPVTLEGVVASIGCNASETIYSLFLIGKDASFSYRADFPSYSSISSFKVGDRVIATGTYQNNNASGNCLHNIIGYQILDHDNPIIIPDVVMDLSVRSEYQDFSSNYKNATQHLVRVVTPYMVLSSKTGIVSNYVRFSPLSSTFAFNDRYFTFSIPYLRQFTDHVGASSTVQFNSVYVRPRDKVIYNQADIEMYCYLAFWGDTSLQFVIVQEAPCDIESDDNYE